MSENQNQASLPTWDSIEATRPKLKWEVNEAHEVVMQSDTPKWYDWEDKGDVTRIFLFDVVHDGEEKVIQTSSIGMLRGLKACTPLKGKRLRITKQLEKGKQRYVVEEL